MAAAVVQKSSGARADGRPRVLPAEVAGDFPGTGASSKRMDDHEGTLRANSDLLAKLAKQVPGVIYQYRMYPDGRSCFPLATEAMWDIYEVTPDEVREDASVVFTRIHPDDLAAGIESIQESARTLETWQWDYRVVLPVQGSGTARPEWLADGSTLWHGFITDITERQEAQVALSESEERFRVQIEHAPEAIVVYDADTNRYTDANQHALDLFGMTRADLPVLFASGYTDDVIASQGVLESNVDFLPKPYSTVVLARRVRAALDRPTLA